MEVVLVFGDVVEGGDVRVRREKLEYLGFCEKALGIKGVSGCYDPFIDGLDGEGFACFGRRTPENGAEFSPADLSTNDVVLIKLLAH